MTDNWGEPEAIEEQPTIEAPEVKLFGKWSLNDVEVSDISLVVRLAKLAV